MAETPGSSLIGKVVKTNYSNKMGENQTYRSQRKIWASRHSRNQQRGQWFFKSTEDQEVETCSLLRRVTCSSVHNRMIYSELYYQNKSYAGPEPKQDQQKLESVQRRATEMIKMLGNGSSEDMQRKHSYLGPDKRWLGRRSAAQQPARLWRTVYRGALLSH